MGRLLSINPIEVENYNKYLRAPTNKQVLKFIYDLGVSDAQFERYYKIPPKTITHIRYGRRKLPAQFWHIIYEKLIPKYKSGYQIDTENDSTEDTSPQKPTISHPGADLI